MNSILNQAVLALAADAVRAPAPKDNSTREDWRKQHKFKRTVGEERVQTLPSETYFAPREAWTPFNTADGKTLLDESNNQEFLKRLAGGPWDHYVIFDKRGELIATTEDFH